ncbi:SCE4755 family polysaccharide monooxygenase-like protein [Phenylobacterium sp.]|uniref:SCE4755 family polysaccharide monooxygenase-like protein n=1 Tax=Phenylobacterium sp. TaxID=1871053 RepID=UPI0035667032
MKLRILAALGAGAVVLAMPAAVSAHFILMRPASWLQENALGDPQKLGPCGGTTANAGTPTAAVTPVTGGALLHIHVKETVYHPGHFRVALSVLDRAELPVDPEDVTKDGPRGPVSVSAKIDPNPKAPVLVDGLWEHHQRQPGQEFETDVKIPNINCDHCSLQVIQFMEEHGINPDGRFTYHHCADLKVTADPKLPIDTAWPGQKASKGKKAKTKS